MISKKKVKFIRRNKKDISLRKLSKSKTRSKVKQEKTNNEPGNGEIKIFLKCKN